MLPSSIRYLQILIAGDSRVSLVLALNANPRIANFFPEMFQINFQEFVELFLIAAIHLIL